MHQMLAIIIPVQVSKTKTKDFCIVQLISSRKNHLLNNVSSFTTERFQMEVLIVMTLNLLNTKENRPNVARAYR